MNGEIAQSNEFLAEICHPPYPIAKANVIAFAKHAFFAKKSIIICPLRQ
jgi:hypothetical protein